MALKRYNIEELIEVCEDTFYEYMVNSKVYYQNFTEQPCASPAEALYLKYTSAIEENKARITDLYIFTTTCTDKTYKNLAQKQIELYMKEQEALSNLNANVQRALYATNRYSPCCRSGVIFPLNKCINSLYDNLWLEVIFYDDISTPAGLFKMFTTSPTELKKEFYKQNVYITSIGLIITGTSNTKSDKGLIVLKGSPDDFQASFVEVLTSNFADFNNLRLADTNTIIHNDLKQVLQSKIDMDKEKLTFLSHKEIRGSEYWLYRNDERPLTDIYSDNYYIRYVCASTGRVYYNQLNLRNLSVSEYFNKSDYSSYLDAWWSIAHLGASIEGEPVISC